MKTTKLKIHRFAALIFAIAAIFSSCSKDEEVRTPENIVGIWQTAPHSYLKLNDDYVARTLEVVDQDDKSVGQWSQTEVYFYEPGYNIVIYLTSYHEAKVFQVVELTGSKLVWCWVENIEIDDIHGVDDLGEVMGEIIKKAQEGYTLNPDLYQSFKRVSEEQFLDIIEGLDSIVYL